MNENNNINKFTRDLETNLLNFNKYNQESIIVNNKTSINSDNNLSILNSEDKYMHISNKKLLYTDIMIYILLFLILNSNYIINLFYSINNNNIINLLLRTIFFGFCIYLYNYIICI
jgi:hypothetical protein